MPGARRQPRFSSPPTAREVVSNRAKHIPNFRSGGGRSEQKSLSAMRKYAEGEHILSGQVRRQIRAAPVYDHRGNHTMRRSKCLMPERNANVDLCGVRNLLSVLEQNGFSRRELRNILARIAAQTGADIILDTD